MNGRIGFSSQWQKGSVFWIDLLLVDSPVGLLSDAAITDNYPAEITPEKYHILCVGCDQESVWRLERLSGQKSGHYFFSFFRRKRIDDAESDPSPSDIG